MKLLYVGSYITQDVVDKIVKTSKNKPSVAPVNFQRNLLLGMSKQLQEMEIFSLPPVAMVPGSKWFGWGKNEKTVYGNIKSSYFPVVNFPILKQFSTAASTFAMVNRWARSNAEGDGKVLVYALTPMVAIPLCMALRSKNIEKYVIITDPVEYASNFQQYGLWKQLLMKFNWILMHSIENRFDGYIVLTEELAKNLGEAADHHIIVEGVADTSIFADIPDVGKANPPALMYSGALTYGFGIPKLLEAFMLTKGDYQLWLYGNGDCEALIREKEKQDSRIHYFGKVKWSEMLTAMKAASCLISFKEPGTIQAKCQFPSKIMEYMASGTPVLSTRIEGIPDAYFDYLIPIKYEVEAASRKIQEILSLSLEELAEIGRRSVRFVEENKSCEIQAKKICDFLQEEK